MRNVRFSIGYNHDRGIIDLLDKHSAAIEALYFPFPMTAIGSGRYIPQERDYAEKIKLIIRKCCSLGITSQLLLNASCIDDKSMGRGGVSKMMSFMELLHAVGLKNVIVTHPLYILEIRRNIPGLTIESSVNCYVKTMEHALYLRDLGVDIITIDRDINRDLELIGRIKEKAGLPIRIMLNEGCLRNCPFRVAHYNFLSHMPFMKRGDRCVTESLDKMGLYILSRYPEKVFSIPFIPPHCLKEYIDVVDFFKLSTRVFSTERIEKCLLAYRNQNYNGNLLDLLDSSCLSYFDFIDYRSVRGKFWRSMRNCKMACESCSYCKRLLKKTVVINFDYVDEKRRRVEAKRAIRLYRSMPGSTQDSFEMHLKSSAAYLVIKDYKQAIREARILLVSHPDKLEGHLVLARVYASMQEPWRVYRTLYKALQSFPDEKRLLAECAKTLFAMRRYRRALKFGEKAIALGFDDPYFLLFLGQSYGKIKDYKRMLITLARAEKLISGDEPQINLLRAQALRALYKDREFVKEVTRGYRKLSSQYSLLNSDEASIRKI
jgi:collagenase-like PrtC family protease